MDPNNTDTTNTPAEGVTPVPEPTTEAPQAEPVTPVDQTNPVNPVTPVSPAASTGAPKPSNNRKIILIAAIAGGVVLLAAIALVVFLLLTSVSKQDYRDAARQFNKVGSASSSLYSDVSMLGYATGSTSDSTFNSDVADTEESIAKLKSENETLSKMKAVRVGEGAKLYNAFNDKLKAYLAYGEDLLTSVKNLRPAMVTCDKVSDASEANARVAALKACSSALSGVTDLPNAEFKTFVSTVAKSYQDYADTYESISALSNPYGNQYDQYKALRDKVYEIQDTISNASDDFSDALEKRDDELSVKDSANKLADFLTDKQK